MDRKESFPPDINAITLYEVWPGRDRMVFCGLVGIASVLPADVTTDGKKERMEALRYGYIRLTPF